MKPKVPAALRENVNRVFAAGWPIRDIVQVFCLPQETVESIIRDAMRRKRRRKA